MGLNSLDSHYRRSVSSLIALIRSGARTAVIPAVCVFSLSLAVFSPANAVDGFTVGTASAGSTPHILGTAMQQLFSEKFPEGRFEVAVTGGKHREFTPLAAQRGKPRNRQHHRRGPCGMPGTDATWNRAKHPTRKFVP